MHVHPVPTFEHCASSCAVAAEVTVRRALLRLEKFARPLDCSETTTGLLQGSAFLCGFTVEHAAPNVNSQSNAALPKLVNILSLPSQCTFVPRVSIMLLTDYIICWNSGTHSCRGDTKLHAGGMS